METWTFGKESKLTDVKRKATLKKANQRARKKSGMRENELASEAKANVEMEPEEYVFEVNENDENTPFINVS